MLRRTALSLPKYISLGKMHIMLNEFSLILCILSLTEVKIRICREKGVFLLCKKLIKC